MVIVFLLPIFQLKGLGRPADDDAQHDAARDALRKVANDTLGLLLGLLIILHTWNQLGEQHLHTHTVLPGGGWLRGAGPRRFVTPPDASWLQPAALMQAFRDALLRHLCCVAERDTLVFAGRAAFLADPVVFGDWIQQLRQRHWVVRLRPPLDDTEVALGYLARYARGGPLGNRRIVTLDPQQGKVTFTYRHNEAGADDQDISDRTTIDGKAFARVRPCVRCSGRVLLRFCPRSFASQTIGDGGVPPGEQGWTRYRCRSAQKWAQVG